MAEQGGDPPSKWLSIWMRDQMFWRDVASRALAGLIVVTVAAIAAAAAGILDITFEFATFIVMWGAFSAVLIWLLWRVLYVTMPERRDRLRPFVFNMSIPIVMVCGGLASLAMNLLGMPLE